MVPKRHEGQPVVRIICMEISTVHYKETTQSCPYITIRLGVTDNTWCIKHKTVCELSLVMARSPTTYKCSHWSIVICVLFSKWLPPTCIYKGWGFDNVLGAMSKCGGRNQFGDGSSSRPPLRLHVPASYVSTQHILNSFQVYHVLFVVIPYWILVLKLKMGKMDEHSGVAAPHMLA